MYIMLLGLEIYEQIYFNYLATRHADNVQVDTS
jgi:hypothetical protein